MTEQHAPAPDIGGPALREETARTLMREFAIRTGLDARRPAIRYLWTDAFAVCNFVGLASRGDAGALELALRLVDQVHDALGKHRPDDSRAGWLSGLPDHEATEHPTIAGLRIGKPRAERGPDEPLDPAGEWDRDGQYFHYLTRWMHALDQLAHATGRAHLNRWARELAHTAHAAFVVRAPGRRSRMVWKMSIDLGRPQVATMGHHDPLDGFVTCAQLRSSARLLGDEAGPDLSTELTTYGEMIASADWTTGDPLGIGGLLADACRIARLRGRLSPRVDAHELLEAVLAAALTGLEHYAASDALSHGPGHRLAFRELGLAIGLAGVDCVKAALLRPARATRAPAPAHNGRIAALLERLDAHHAVRTRIEETWLAPAARAHRTWRAHRDINEVMLATSLVPDGFLARPARG